MEHRELTTAPGRRFCTRSCPGSCPGARQGCPGLQAGVRGPVLLTLSCSGHQQELRDVSGNPHKCMINPKYVIPDRYFSLWALNPLENS